MYGASIPANSFFYFDIFKFLFLLMPGKIDILLCICIKLNYYCSPFLCVGLSFFIPIVLKWAVFCCSTLFHVVFLIVQDVYILDHIFKFVDVQFWVLSGLDLTFFFTITHAFLQCNHLSFWSYYMYYIVFNVLQSSMFCNLCILHPCSAKLWCPFDITGH